MAAEYQNICEEHEAQSLAEYWTENKQMTLIIPIFLEDTNVPKCGLPTEGSLRLFLERICRTTNKKRYALINIYKSVRTYTGFEV